MAARVPHAMQGGPTKYLYQQHHVYYSRDVVVALFRGVAGHNVGEDEVCAVV